MIIKCVVLDDDPVFSKVIAKFVESHPRLHLVKVFNRPDEARQFLNNNDIQLLFADIEMPGVTGIDFAKSLQYSPEIIFVTAHRDYAIQSYELQAIDYLMKPVDENRFNSAVNRAILLIELNSQSHTEKSSLALQIQDDHFFIRSDSQFVRIKFAEIFYIEALKDFVKIHTRDKTHVALINLKNIEAALPASLFLRTHRSYLVNREYITAISAETIETVATTLPLGNSYKDIVMEEILGNKLIKRN